MPQGLLVLVGRLFSVFVQEDVDQLAKYGHSGLPISTHGLEASLAVPLVGPGSQPDKWREVVSKGDEVSPNAGIAAIAVGERMNSDPFCVCPGADVYHRVLLILARLVNPTGIVLSRSATTS